MASMNNETAMQWLMESSFISKEYWSAYVDYNQQQGTFEDLGYIDATEAVVEKLEEAIKINDDIKFRSTVLDLINNRRDLLDHALKLMNCSMTQTSYEKSLGIKP